MLPMLNINICTSRNVEFNICEIQVIKIYKTTVQLPL